MLFRILCVAAACPIVVVMMMVSSCETRTGPVEATSTEMYFGEPARRTPYDGRYERVRQYMREAREKIQYLPEPEGEDYWQLPEETERLGTGDCEDFAIWLYAKMKRSGIEDVRLCIGKYQKSAALMHAWLLWYHGDDVYVLDPSVTDEPIHYSQLEPDSYIPHYSYDGDFRWTHRAAQY